MVVVEICMEWLLSVLAEGRTSEVLAVGVIEAAKVNREVWKEMTTVVTGTEANYFAPQDEYRLIEKLD